jgi:ubiquinone/menaquinone biosynthesis C-methylase UbiE
MFHPHGPTFWELAEQCLSSTERGYDLLARKFDYTPFRTPDEILDGLANFLGPPQSIDTALDICCGTGAAIRILRPLCRTRVVGIDFSRGMLDVARQRFPNDSGLATVELVLGDVLQMDFRHEFDLAITVGSLGHILPQHQQSFIERIAAALRPRGRFAFVTSEMPPRWSRSYIFSRAFNAAMHVRNALWRPPFIMYYLTLLLPEAKRLLEEQGFQVAVHHDAFSGPFRALKVVIGTKHS